MTLNLTLQESNESIQQRIKLNVRTVYIVMGVVGLLIAFGIFQVATGSPIRSIALAVTGLIALPVLLMVRNIVKQADFNKAGYIIITTLFLMIETTLLIDPDNSWIIGPVLSMVLTQIVGQFLDRRNSPRGVLLAVIAGGIITLSDTLRKTEYKIMFNETVVITLVIGLFFLVRLFLTYRSFSLGAKIMLVMSGMIILGLTVMTASALVTFQILTSNLTGQAGGAGVLNEMSRWIVLSGGLTMILSGLVAWWMTGSVLTPLNRVVDLVKAIAENGDLSQKSNIHREDELGTLSATVDDMVDQLKGISSQMTQVANRDLTLSFQPKSPADTMGNAFALMIENLKNILSGLVESLDALDATTVELSEAVKNSKQATNQIAVTMQEIARGASQQNEAISKTVASVEMSSKVVETVGRGAEEQAVAISQASNVTHQINLAIQQVAGNAQVVSKEAARATEAARTGSEIVKQTIDGMQAISMKVGISTQKVQEMGEHSNQIGMIVETIEDIASQTNMLALNAAIEAARAGEQGKGFAVVADEVRKLAERSSGATKQISTLIHSIQTTVSDAILAMQVGSKEVENGTELANRAGNALALILQAADAVASQANLASTATETMINASNQLMDTMRFVSNVAEENTTATQSMTVSSNEAAQSVESIASISEENSASVEEVSASAEEINAQIDIVSKASNAVVDKTRSLHQLVNQFHL